MLCVQLVLVQRTRVMDGWIRRLAALMPDAVPTMAGRAYFSAIPWGSTRVSRVAGCREDELDMLPTVRAAGPGLPWCRPLTILLSKLLQGISNADP